MFKIEGHIATILLVIFSIAVGSSIMIYYAIATVAFLEFFYYNMKSKYYDLTVECKRLKKRVTELENEIYFSDQDAVVEPRYRGMLKVIK